MNLQLSYQSDIDLEEAEILGKHEIETTSHLNIKGHRSMHTTNTSDSIRRKTSRQKHFFSRDLVKNRNVTIVRVGD